MHHVQRCLFMCAAAIANPAFANLYFADQVQVATGAFEWDRFAGSSFTSLHLPDVRSLGVGSATVAGGVAAPGFAPPPMVVPGDRDLYTGSARTFFTIKVDSASTDNALTTLVLQFTVDPQADVIPSTIAMNGLEPTELVDRGVGSDELHYYWAEWQLPAASTMTATFQPIHGPQGDHFVLYGAQLDYYNGAALFNAVAGVPVPEPPALGLAGLGLAVFVLRRKRGYRSVVSAA